MVILYKPAKAPSTVAGPVFLQLGATVFALISMATQGADLGRFVRKKDQLVGSIFNGYVVMIVTFLGVVLLGSYFGLEFHQTNPGTYFSSVLGIGGMLTVIITQLRINTINVYSGSLAYSNFFSRVFHFTPGRQWWGILTAILGTLLMMGNIFAPFVSASLGLIFPPVIALALKGRPYRISSTAVGPVTSQPMLECILCHKEFETVDMVICPFHEGALCSVCCGSNAQCHDVCKTEGVIVQTLTVEQP